MIIIQLSKVIFKIFRCCAEICEGRRHLSRRRYHDLLYRRIASALDRRLECGRWRRSRSFLAGCIVRRCEGEAVRPSCSVRWSAWRCAAAASWSRRRCRRKRRDFGGETSWWSRSHWSRWHLVRWCSDTRQPCSSTVNRIRITDLTSKNERLNLIIMSSVNLNEFVFPLSFDMFTLV